jgi:hypothetical protein
VLSSHPRRALRGRPISASKASNVRAGDRSRPRRSSVDPAPARRPCTACWPGGETLAPRRARRLSPPARSATTARATATTASTASTVSSPTAGTAILGCRGCSGGPGAARRRRRTGAVRGSPRACAPRPPKVWRRRKTRKATPGSLSATKAGSEAMRSAVAPALAPSAQLNVHTRRPLPSSKHQRRPVRLLLVRRERELESSPDARFQRSSRASARVACVGRCSDSSIPAVNGRSSRGAETAPFPRSRSLPLRTCSSSNASASERIASAFAPCVTQRSGFSDGARPCRSTARGLRGTAVGGGGKVVGVGVDRKA